MIRRPIVPISPDRRTLSNVSYVGDCRDGRVDIAGRFVVSRQMKGRFFRFARKFRGFGIFNRTCRTVSAERIPRKLSGASVGLSKCRFCRNRRCVFRFGSRGTHQFRSAESERHTQSEVFTESCEPESCSRNPPE